MRQSRDYQSILNPHLLAQISWNYKCFTQTRQTNLPGRIYFLLLDYFGASQFASKHPAPQFEASMTMSYGTSQFGLLRFLVNFISTIRSRDVFWDVKRWRVLAAKHGFWRFLTSWSKCWTCWNSSCCRQCCCGCRGWSTEVSSTCSSTTDGCLSCSF